MSHLRFLLVGLISLAVSIPGLAAAQEPTGPSTRVVDVTQRLGRGDATLSGGEFYDSYEFEVQAGDVLRAEVRASSFDTYVMLRSPSGETVSNDDYDGRKDYSMVLTTAQESGTWMLVVTSYAKDSQGDYSAVVTRWAAAGRPDGREGGGGGRTALDTQGRLQAGDSTLPAGEFVDRYPFEAQAGQLITVDMTSASFDTYVGLISPSGAALENDDFNGDKSHSRVETRAAEGGTWTAVATSMQPAKTGPYRVQVVLGGGGAVPSQRPLPPPASSRGTLLDVSGRLAAGDSTLGTGEYVDTYTFQADAGADLTAELSSSSFDTYLGLQSPSGEVFQNDDLGGRKDRSRVEVSSAEGGTWSLMATSYAVGETGDYHAVVTGGSVAPSDDGVRRGTLAAGDEQLPAGEYADHFTLEGTEGEHLVLDLRSSAFDPYLALGLPGGEQWQNDDHEGSASRSQIAVVLPKTGSYVVVVTSYKPGESGAWELTISRSGDQGAPVDSGWAKTGELAVGDTTLDTGEYIDVHTFEGLPGQQVRIDLASTAFDPYLVVLAPSGEKTENDDAPGLPGHSLVELTLTEVGTYSVGVTSYKAGETGSYQLTIGQEAAAPRSEPTQRDVGRLALRVPVTGALEASDSVLDTGERWDSWSFDGVAGQAVRLDMASTAFDPYLGLVLPSGEVIQNDDWEGSSSQSRIALVLPEAGRYRVVATSYRPGVTGDYRLVLQPDETPTIEASSTAPASGRIFGVFVGISDYSGEESDLPFTANDARTLHAAFLNSVGMAGSDAVLLTDAQATQAAVTGALAQHAARMTDDDRLVFFFSGHGVRVAREGPYQSAEPDNQDETIALYDGLMTDDALALAFDEVPGTALIVIDACFSGGFSKDVISRPGRMGLFSSHEDVTSSVAAKFQAGGYLAQFMVEAIGERAADDGDGQLTALELSQYLYDRYRSDVKTMGAPEGAVDSSTGLKEASDLDYVLTNRNLGYQQLVVDRGGVSPYKVLFSW